VPILCLKKYFIIESMVPQELHYRLPEKIHWERNCLIENAAAAIKMLQPGLRLNERNAFDLITSTRTRDLANLFALLNQEGLPVHYDVLKCPTDYLSFVETTRLVHLHRAISELEVVTETWIRRFHNKDVSTDDTHSILMAGYYQPTRSISSLYAYTYDPYPRKVIFLPVKNIFDFLLREGRTLEVGIFSNGDIKTIPVVTRRYLDSKVQGWIKRRLRQSTQKTLSRYLII